MKVYIAEAIGTCLLALVLVLTAGANPWISTIFAVFTLTYIAYGFGHVSGAHVNPALTIGGLATGKMSALRAFYYIIAQVAGAAAAVLIVKAIGAGIDTAPADAAFSWKLFVAELVGTFVFAYGVAAVWGKKVEKGPSGFVVGISLFAGIIISSLFLSGVNATAVLNPAVAYALGVLSISSTIGAILGAILGMWTYVALGDDCCAAWAGFKKAWKKESSSTASTTENKPEGVHIA